MRLLTMLMACVGVAFAQSNQDTESNTSCVERLQMPVYPPLARVAWVSGSVVASVVVASDGTMHANVVGYPLLTATVDKALHASTFRASCGAKTVKLLFDFTIDKGLDPATDLQRVSFSYPNQFLISVPPAPFMP